MKTYFITGIVLALILSCPSLVTGAQTFIVQPIEQDPFSISVRGFPPADSSLTEVKSMYDFGDSYVSTLGSPGHTYKNPGNYTITLTSIVKDRNEFFYTSITSMKVRIPALPLTITQNSPSVITRPVPTPLVSPALSRRAPVNITISTAVVQQTDPFYDIPYLGLSTLPVVRIPKDTWDPFPKIPYLGGIY